MGVILNTVLRGIWVILAFCFAAFVAVAVLFALGAIWVGDELRAAAPHDPVLHYGGAPVFGMVLFTGTVAPALTSLPGLIAAVAGEVLRLRSWMYYVLAGGVALAAVPLLASTESSDFAAVASSQYMAIFLAAGFAGGFVYWLLAGRSA
jgi:hypothetical protein